MIPRSVTKERRTGRAWVTRALLALLFLTVAAAFTGYYFRQVRWFARALEERAHVMLDVLEAAVAAHLRNGKYNSAQLEPILGRLAEAPLVVELSVTIDGRTLAQAESNPTDRPVSTYHRATRIDAEAPPGHGRSAPRGPSALAGWFPFPTEPVTLTVSMDESRFRANRAGAGLQLGLSLLGTGIAFGLAFLVTESRRRQRNLELDLLLARERVAHHQQLAQLGAGLAHETKNPLGLVRGMAQSISEDDVPASVRERATLIIDEVDRTVRHVNGFLDLARDKEPVLTDVSTEGLFDGLGALVNQEAHQQGIDVSWRSNGVGVRADEALLRRALLNLVLNALKASEDGGQVTVTAELDRDGARIAVEDNGKGIAPEDLPNVRSPYFSRFDGGTGLGLAIVDRIAHAHGWRLDIASQPDRGTRVSLEGIHPV